MIAVGDRFLHWDYDWSQIPAGEVRKGDLLANHGTVTHVHHGPKAFRWGGSEYTLDAEHGFIACGNGSPHGFAYSKIHLTRSLLVVGRNGRRVWVDPPTPAAPTPDPDPFDFGEAS